MGVVSAHQREQPELPFAFTVTNPGTIVEEPFSPWGFAAGYGQVLQGCPVPDRAPLGHR